MRTTILQNLIYSRKSAMESANKLPLKGHRLPGAFRGGDELIPPLSSKSRKNSTYSIVSGKYSRQKKMKLFNFLNFYLYSWICSINSDIRRYSISLFFRILKIPLFSFSLIFCLDSNREIGKIFIRELCQVKSSLWNLDSSKKKRNVRNV